MNTIHSPAAQAPSSPAPQVFPQPIPSVVMAMPLGSARLAVLKFLDAGAITVETAESWIVALENLKS